MRTELPKPFDNAPFRAFRDDNGTPQAESLGGFRGGESGVAPAGGDDVCLWAMDAVGGLACAADAPEFEGAGGLEGVEFEVDVVACSGGEGGRVNEGCNDVEWFRYEVRDGEAFVEAGRSQYDMYG